MTREDPCGTGAVFQSATFEGSSTKKGATLKAEHGGRCNDFRPAIAEPTHKCHPLYKGGFHAKMTIL